MTLQAKKISQLCKFELRYTIFHLNFFFFNLKVESTLDSGVSCIKLGKKHARLFITGTETGKLRVNSFTLTKKASTSPILV
jgi:hypothetical protein